MSLRDQPRYGTTDYADLAALEKVQNQMMLDQGYWQLVEKAFKGGLFIDASGNDIVSRLI